MAEMPRRVGSESSVTRAAILEAAENLLREEGYGAVSTRRVASRAGLKPSLVHYYFPTTDDLFLAMFERGAEQSDAMLAAALAAPDPLRGLWDFLSDTSRTTITLEFMALATRRTALSARIAQHAHAMREREAEMIAGALGDRLAGEGACPPRAFSLILAGVARALVMEGALGVSDGHAEARRYVEQLLDRLRQSSDPAEGRVTPSRPPAP